MKKTIRLSVSHPEIADGPIQGFRFFWAYYVSGFNQSKHCQPCFRGRLATQFCSPAASSGASYELDAMDRYPYVYVCGVGSGTKDSLSEKNFHLPMQYSAGDVLTMVTYNGYQISAENAIALPRDDAVQEFPVRGRPFRV